MSEPGEQPSTSGEARPPTGGPRPARLVLVAGLAAVTVLALAIARLAPTQTGQVPGSSLRSGSGGASQGSNASLDLTDPAVVQRELAALFATRSAAIRRDSPTGWRSTQVAHARVPVFARLAALPITRWTYRVSSIEAADDPASIVVIASVHYRYDVDIADAVLKERLTVRHTSKGWLVTAESTADPRAQPWDIGPLTVVHGRASLVIGIGVSRSLVRRYALLADQAVPDVSAVWGTGWNRHPVVLVPRSAAMLGRGLGRTAASLEDFAAVTVSEGGTAAQPVLRIWTNTIGMTSLSALGREIVMRHEVTHVATAAPLTPSVPLWLEEGFAEYVGYLGTGIPLDVALGELTSAERRSRAPQHLPAPEAFSGAKIDIAYESADLAVRLLVEGYGQAAFVRVYRLTAAGTGTAQVNVDAALRAVTGRGTAAFEATWRARISRLAA